jgi:SAM-dependent methyltransferase
MISWGESRLTKKTADGFNWKKLIQTWRPGNEDALNKVNIDAARALVTEVNKVVPFAKASFIHDVGTGSGVVVDEISSSTRILATDVFPLMLDEIKDRQKLALSGGSEHWERLEIQQMNAEDLTGIEDDSTSHIMAGYLMYALSDYKKMLSEVKRTLAPDGVFGYNVNAVAPWVSILAVISKVRPDKVAPYPPAQWHTAASNTKVLEEAGFKDIRTAEVNLDLWYNSHEQMVDYVLDMMPFMSMLLEGMTEEEIAKYRQLMIDQLREESPSLPGKMAGKAVIATAKK